MAMLVQYMPCMPSIPRFKACEPGKLPMPSSVVTTGILAVLRELSQLVEGAGDDYAVARQDQRPLRLERSALPPF